MSQFSEEMENYRDRVANFADELREQPTTGEDIAKINDTFYIVRNPDGTKTVMQYGVPDTTKNFVLDRIAEMGLTTKKAQEPVEEVVGGPVLYPEFAEL